MSVTKTRPSGLSAINRPPLSPCAATLRANPSGKFKKKEFPSEIETRFGTSLKALTPAFDCAARRCAEALRCAEAPAFERRSAANAKSIRRLSGMCLPFKKGSESLQMILPKHAAEPQANPHERLVDRHTTSRRVGPKKTNPATSDNAGRL